MANLNLGATAEYPRGLGMSDGQVGDLDIGYASFVRLEPTVPGDPAGMWDLSGIAGGEEGRIVTLWNNTGVTCRILEYDFVGNLSSAGNLIVIAGIYNSSSVFWLYDGEMVTLQYLDGPPGGQYWRIRHGLVPHGPYS